MLSIMSVVLPELWICPLWKLQDVVGRHHMLEQSRSNILESVLVVDTNMESFGSVKAGPSLVNSTGFFIFSAEDACSAIDFSKAPIDDGVVDSLPCNNSKQSGVSSSLPLKSWRWKAIGITSPQRDRRSQCNGPFHVANAMEMTNAGANSPFALKLASEDELRSPWWSITRVERGIGQGFYHAKAGRVLSNRLKQLKNASRQPGFLTWNTLSLRSAVKQHLSIEEEEYMEQINVESCRSALRVERGESRVW